MNHEEMAEELRRAGWRVDRHVYCAAETCKHVNRQGSGNSDSFTWRCNDCGKTWPEQWDAAFAGLPIQSHNHGQETETMGERKRQYSYDLACEELARHFLSDVAREDLARDLAQHIQDTVELWLEYEIAKRGGTPPKLVTP